MRFWVSASTGQKTGFYADQRDSRLAMRHLAEGRAVLDLCCYTGGFALNALAGGATHVTGQLSLHCCHKQIGIEEQMKSTQNGGWTGNWDLGTLALLWLPKHAISQPACRADDNR